MTADTSDAARTFGRHPEAGSGQQEPAATPSRDPDLDLDGVEPLNTGSDASDADDLEAELNAELTPTVTLPVEGRPRYAVTYRIDTLTGKYLDKLGKRAKDKSYKEGIDGVRFAAIGLAELCVAVLRDGKPLELDGEVVTFTHRGFQELLGAPSAVPAVLKLYGREGHVSAAMTRLVDEAGWMDPADVVDPT